MAARARTRAEVEAYLSRKGWSGSTVRRALQSLDRVGYIDDLELARRSADRYLLDLGWGPAKVAWELTRRGVPEKMVERVLAESQATIPVEELARRALEKRFQSGGERRGRAYRMKAFRFLVARGFDPAVAGAVLGVEDENEGC